NLLPSPVSSPLDPQLDIWFCQLAARLHIPYMRTLHVLLILTFTFLASRSQQMQHLACTCDGERAGRILQLSLPAKTGKTDEARRTEMVKAKKPNRPLERTSHCAPYRRTTQDDLLAKSEEYLDLGPPS
ncbi:hypothetical protein BaRGS_00024207, partial [Batillaria attramentaria]